jgi:hypothetical protein
MRYARAQAINQPSGKLVQFAADVAQSPGVIGMQA